MNRCTKYLIFFRFLVGDGGLISSLIEELTPPFIYVLWIIVWEILTKVCIAKDPLIGTISQYFLHIAFDGSSNVYCAILLGRI